MNNTSGIHPRIALSALAIFTPAHATEGAVGRPNRPAASPFGDGFHPLRLEQQIATRISPTSRRARDPIPASFGRVTGTFDMLTFTAGTSGPGEGAGTSPEALFPSSMSKPKRRAPGRSRYAQRQRQRLFDAFFSPVIASYHTTLCPRSLRCTSTRRPRLRSPSLANPSSTTDLLSHGPLHPVFQKGTWMEHHDRFDIYPETRHRLP